MAEGAGQIMSYAHAPDGVKIYWEEAGDGRPVLFVHEFAGDHRSWAPQVAQFSRSHRCISYAARGYPPSEVPTDVAAYSQSIAVADAVAVLDAAEVDQAHIVGISMGGFTALHMAVRHPDRCTSIVVSGAGYGASPESAEGFRIECEAIARAFEERGASEVAPKYAEGPARVQFQNKDPVGWKLFAESLGEHHSTGAALTMRGVQMRRPSLYDMTDQLLAIRVPCLIIIGDEDEGCIEASVMLKRTIQTAGLYVMPNTGHTANLEEPALYNQAIGQLFSLAEAGRWPARDPRSLAKSTTGMDV